MFGPPGHAYVYLVYGMYHCLNVVTQPRGFPAALLVRSVDPVEGGDLMRRARQEWIVARAARDDDGLAGAARAAAARQRVAALPIERLASGPGLVCAAFSIGRGEDGVDLCDPAASLRLEPARPDDPAAGADVRSARRPRRHAGTLAQQAVAGLGGGQSGRVGLEGDR